MVAEKFNFNKGLLKLEEIINKMESGDLSLEESLNTLKRGLKFIGNAILRFQMLSSVLVF
jgi:exodeoxyribonuclease VII small subunit